MATTPTTGTFDFARDTFAFRNELVWEYRVDDRAGRTVTVRAEPPPTYAHRCFVMVRSARQFWLHARFDPAAQPPDDSRAEALAREVVRRNPRAPGREDARVVIPGNAGLRDFSRAFEPALKRACGQAWESYFLRSHWRMVFPFSRTHQAREAVGLATALNAGRLPIVHVVRFPQLTINHGLLLFGAESTSDGVRFTAYDPNQPEASVSLRYDQAARTFHLPANHYWAGGRVDVFETYRGWFY
ncbi:MAG: hypothetical protein H7A45_03440 [Verrucomicrobiales bacterium]|nr:hypothetical protein [Verrucomicrobiales bacterium]MCP5527752.1 hypothetical protein [Verrucomicrobiales bacterium]